MNISKRIIRHSIDYETGTAEFANGFIFGDYGWSLEKYKQLAEIAKRDFPFLKDEDIEIDRVRESTYMKDFSYIRFSLPSDTVATGYTMTTRKDFE